MKRDITNDKRSLNLKAIAILIVSVPNNWPSKDLKQKLIKLKEGIDKFSIIEISILLS